MSTLISEFKSCDDNKLVQLISIQEGDILDFKGCDIILATYRELDDKGVQIAIYEDKPVVQFKDGSQIGLSKLTTHFVDSKPVRTKIGEAIKGRTKKEVVKQLRDLGRWKCTYINAEAVTKTGATTKEYTFEEVKE